MLATLSAAAPRADAQAADGPLRPTWEAPVLALADGSGYVASRAFVTDYVVCAAEADLFGAEVDLAAHAAEAARAHAEAAHAEAAAYEAAADDLALALHACDGRREIAQDHADDLAARLAEADHARLDAERSRSRWRAVATVTVLASGAFLLVR